MKDHAKLVAPILYVFLILRVSQSKWRAIHSNTSRFTIIIASETGFNIFNN